MANIIYFKAPSVLVLFQFDLSNKKCNSHQL